LVIYKAKINGLDTFAESSLVNFDDISNLLPENNILLDLEVSTFSIKMVATGLSLSSATISNLEWAINGTKKALNGLKSSFEKYATGHYQDNQNMFAGAQMIPLHGSYELSFIFRKRDRLLEDALSVVTMLENGEENSDIAKKVTNLKHFQNEVIKNFYVLSPTSRSRGNDFDSIVIGGSLMGGKELSLTRAHRDKYSEANRKDSLSTKTLVLSGEVKALDTTNSTFRMEMIEKNELDIKSILLSFSEPLAFKPYD